MNPRNFINFFKKPIGAFVLFCVVLVIAYFALKRFMPGATKVQPLDMPMRAMTADTNQIVESYHNTNYSPVVDPPNTSADQDWADTPGASRNGQPPPKPEELPISLYAQPDNDQPRPLSKDFAPFGRLIPCELIVTVDSSSIETPIIGLVTDNVYHNGRLVIPAGTEVHGRAQTDRSRERIASDNNWTLVWQDGRELKLSGIALDRDFDPNGTGWDITDGSAGLRGTLLKTDDMAEIKLFAASFLSAAASTLDQNQETLLGPELLPTTQNAALSGAQAVIGAYANQIYDSIQRDGFYVRVPAGKQFYLYVTETIDVSQAALGGTRFTPNDYPTSTNQNAVAASRSALPPGVAMPYRNGVYP
ncbi:MAG TPA: TrbI/VirB10 family protein [Pseudomonadales bacterium]|nr:TrbI/VirB10 family protein [Pseudomonadales bacterium]